MENTKDVIFNVRYASEVKVINFRKKGLWKKVCEKLYQNKFISLVVGITIALVSIDVVMLTYFIEIIGKM